MPRRGQTLRHQLPSLLPAPSSPPLPCHQPSAAKQGPYGASSRLLFQFKSAEDLAKWSPFSDAELGGHSSAALTLADEPQAWAGADGFAQQLAELSA